MPRYFYVQRQHIISSLDTLLYQLLTLSFLLSPSLWLYTCRIAAQFACSKPRELDSNRALRFFYAISTFLSIPSLWIHSTRGRVEGRAIILDFIGMSHNPTKLQLCFLDLFILFLQFLLIAIAYETSAYLTIEDTDAVDILLAEAPKITPFPDPSLFPSAQQKITAFPANTAPLVMDLHLNTVLLHLHHHAPSPRRTPNSVLPLPNTTPFSVPGMRTLLQAGRPMRFQRPNTRNVIGSGQMRMPGTMEGTPDR